MNASRAAGGCALLHIDDPVLYICCTLACTPNTWCLIKIWELFTAAFTTTPKFF